MTEKVKKQILAIRDTGLTNMFAFHHDRRVGLSLATRRARRLFWSYMTQKVINYMCEIRAEITCYILRLE